MPLRIQFITDRYFPAVGGAERQLALMAATLHKRGHYLQILTRHLQPDLPLHETIAGIPVTRLRPTGLGKIANALIILRMLVYLIQHRHTFDIIHSQNLGPVEIAAVLSGRLLKKPVVLRAAGGGNITRQEVRETLSPYTRFIRRYIITSKIWIAILNQAHTLIVLSQELEEEAKSQHVRIPIRLIPNSVDTNLYTPLSSDEKHNLRRQLALSNDHLVLFTSGRLVLGKRLDVLIAAMPEILQQYPTCRLYIAGSGEQQTDSVEVALRQQVQDLGLGDAVIFLGLIPNVVDYLQTVDIFVFPSEKEGMPNALLEAMACGLPAVACDIGGVRDIVAQDTAILIPSGSVTALRDAILNLLENKILAQQIGQQARQHIVEHFSIDAIAAQYEQLYQTLLANTR